MGPLVPLDLCGPRARCYDAPVMLTSQSDGIDAALAFAPAERSHAPQRPRVRSLALVAADVAGLALTVLLCAKFLPISAPGAAAGIPLAAAVWIVAFERAGELVARFFFVEDPDGYKIEVLQRHGRFQ